MPFKKRKCAFRGCTYTNTSEEKRSMHTIPADERYTKWLVNIGREDLLQENSQKVRSNCMVCSNHFSERCFTNTLSSTTIKKRLIPFAVPDIVYKTVVMDELEQSDPGSTKENEGEPAPKRQRYEFQEETKSPEQSVSFEEKEPVTPVKDNPRSVRITTPKTRRINSLRVQVCRLKSQAKKIHERQMSYENALQKIRSGITPVLYEAVKNCLNSSLKFGKRCRWTPHMKRQALNIYLQSPGTYKRLRKDLYFPSKATLLRVLKNYNIEIGFNDKAFELLKTACSKMRPIDRFCVLMWDEVSLKENLTYSEKKDVVDGFERYDEDSSEGRIANQALVFMVRGLCRKYKQVLGYYFAHASTPAEILANLVKSAICRLENAGLKVVATVCDQGTNNQKLYKLLGVQRESPSFDVNGEKIFCFFDTPHLIKSTRNMFKKYNVKFGDKTALWSHIKYLFDMQEKSPLKLTNLTHAHINVKGYRTMRVKLAAQTLSHRVAAGICMLTTCGALPAAALHTSEFVENIDKAFDSLNGRSMTHAKDLCKPVKEGSKHVQVWEEMIVFFNSIVFVNCKGKSVHAPSTSGWIQNFNAAKLLWDKVKLCGMKFLLMGRINQDCLENTFSIIRRQGGSINPSCHDFIFRFRAIFSQNLITCSEKSNCEDDCDDVLVSESCKTVFDGAESVSVNRPLQNLFNVTFKVTDFESLHCEIVNGIFENAAYYVAGYIVKRIAEKECDVCCQNLIDAEHSPPENVTIMMFREYRNEERLVYPSRNMFKCVKEMVKVFDSHMAELLPQVGVGKKIYKILCDEIDFTFMPVECEKNCKNYFLVLFVRMMLHARLKSLNSRKSSDEPLHRVYMQKILHK